MTGCSFHIFAPCHSWCGTKKNRTRNKDFTCLRSHIVRPGKESCIREGQNFQSVTVKYRKLSGAIRDSSGNMWQWQKMPGATGQHGCLFSFDPGVYDRMRFPYIRTLPLMAWHEENLCPPTGKAGNIFKRNLRRHEQKAHRQSDG